MAKMIYVTEAARQLGVSDQTIRNWAERGVLKIKKMSKAHYVDGDLIKKIGNFASDVAKSQQELDKIRKEIQEDRRKEFLSHYDKVNYRRYTNLCVEGSIRSEFFKTILLLMEEYEMLNKREAGILSERLSGKSLEDLCDEYGLTRERVRQISEKAIRKSREIDVLIREIRDIGRLRADAEAMKMEIKTLKEQLHMQQETESLSDEERKKRIIESDSLCQLLSAKLTDFSLSVRSLNCIKAYGDTEGRKSIVTVGDLCKLTEEGLLKQRNFGKKSLAELHEFLSSRGLGFGMDVDGMYRERVEYLMNI